MRIGIILGSTRGERLGVRVVRYIVDQAAAVPGAEFVVLDLAGYDLPFFCEPLAPLDNGDRQVPPNVRRWLDDVASVDGYVFVVPEYNFEVPAAAKNALDLLAHEAEGKPAWIQSYSDTSYGGIVAGHLFRLPLSKLGMFPMPRSLPMAHAERLFDESGALVADTEWARIIARFVPWSLAELVRYASALAPLRDQARTLREVLDV
ncbi:MAG TPA: NAD(P)H-dependent oxidoreductase [Candidatus Dormibacteraeota bacterium]|jgi:NAD(P)H-dependent FMN reductase|nr:NAD(P)H-dependent oxidoreductase [Candidatus Dormibacteraeota bacterium]